MFNSSQLQRPMVLTLLRIVGAGMGFVAHLLLAWILPPEQLGVFFSASSLVTVATLLTSQGFPQVTARFFVRYKERGQEARARSFVARILSETIYASLLFGAIVAALAWLWPNADATTRWTYTICAAIIIAASVMAVECNIAGAAKRFALCYVPDGLIRPALTALVMSYLVYTQAKPDSADIAAVFALIIFAVTIGIHLAMRKTLGPIKLQPLKGDRLVKRWRREARPLILLSLFTQNFADLSILIVSPLLSSTDVAVFGLCMKLAMLVGYIVQVTQQMQVPDLAAAMSRRPRADTGPIIRRAVIIPSVVTFIALLGALLVGDRVLGVFGAHFAAGYGTLVILVAGQFVRAMSGPGAHLVTLRGAQDMNAALCAGAIVVLLGASVAMAPHFGVKGAGFAVVSSLLFWVVGLAMILRKLGEERIDALALLSVTRRGFSGQTAST